MVAPLATFAASLAVGAVKGLAAGALRQASPGQAGGADAAAGAGARREAKARGTAKDFETLFLEQTLDRMLSGASEEGPLGENGPGGGVYRSMLAREYAGQIVKSGGVGLGDQVFREMMRMQEVR
jgi:Rod binding domain-containing protein